MKRLILIAMAIVASLTHNAFAGTIIHGGTHAPIPNGLLTFPIIVTTDSNDQVAGLDLHLTLPDPNGPIFTDITLIEGTVFEGNNTGMTNFGEGFTTPGRNLAYFTTTIAGTVPVGIVAWVTVDFTGVVPGVYELLLSQPDGDSAALSFNGTPGTYTNGIFLEPEPGSIVMATLGALGLFGFAARRRHRARSV